MLRAAALELWRHAARPIEVLNGSDDLNSHFVPGVRSSFTLLRVPVLDYPCPSAYIRSRLRVFALNKFALIAVRSWLHPDLILSQRKNSEVRTC
jgi:hypothetical protein